MLALTIAGSYVVVMLAAIYVPAFFPKWYNRLHQTFNNQSTPPYWLVALFWPLMLVFYGVLIMIDTASNIIIRGPQNIADWMKTRQERKQIRIQEAKQLAETNTPDIDIPTSEFSYRHANCSGCGKTL